MKVRVVVLPLYLVSLALTVVVPVDVTVFAGAYNVTVRVEV
jgi:hypothetical protein